MKYKLLFFLFLFVSISFAQTGTIKIAKPAPVKKDTIVKTRPSLTFVLSAGGNYTFKKNSKIGFDAGITYVPRSPSFKHGVSIGLQYSLENIYFILSPYNKMQQQADTGYAKSQNKMEFIKLPVHINYAMMMGNNTRVDFSFGVMPEYLINTKNEYGRLMNRDFNQFNVAGLVGIRFQLYRNFELSVRYSKELFQRLKDRNVYDSNGKIIGKQDETASLLSVSLVYGFSIKRK
jgi:hypothetical protein